MSSDMLFALLDGCLAADRGPPGFAAKIGVAVFGARGVEWWVAELGREARSTRPKETPDGCDAVLFMSADEAGRLIAGKAIAKHSRTFSMIGDVKQLTRFSRRYVDRKGVVGIRLVS
jgi:hypothetical protein